jgi:RNA polymerase sigma-70 factor (ECF subfamily)
LLRVVSNASLDLGRQRGRREAVCLDAVVSTEPESGPLVTFERPAQGLEQEELRDLLQEALATLPEAQRKTFVLHVDGELNYREVAEVLGISIGTVMSRLFYARQKLRAYLARRVKL